MKRGHLIRWSLLLASMLVFAICLTQDSLYVDLPGHETYAPCWSLLLIGWLGILDGIYAWLANPLLLIAWVLTALGRYKVAACAALILAIAFSSTFLLHREIMANQIGRHSAIIGYGYGYWLWNLSIVIALTSAILGEFDELTDLCLQEPTSMSFENSVPEPKPLQRR